MLSALRRLRFGTRLSLIVLVMMMLTLGASFLVSAHQEAELIREVQNQTESLSKALQISVQHLTTQGMSDDTLLQDYVQRLSSSGVREISILSNEKTVVASSNQAMIGRRIGDPRPRPGSLVITGTLGEDDTPGDEAGTIVQELHIPIVVDDQKRGYVYLRLILDDFGSLLRAAHARRVAATIAIFVAGIGGVAVLAFRMTRELNWMASAAAKVADGDLSVHLETRRQDEVGRLIGTFNMMTQTLRDRRALESRLRRAEHSSSIAHLASAVAHEIRNPLNLISLTVDHLGAEYPPADPARRAEYQGLILSVREELARLNRLVSDFLTYGRPPRLSLSRCRVEEVLEEVLALAPVSAAGRRVEIVKKIGPGVGPVMADPMALRTCFLNIVANAMQAMPSGGTLTVEASHASAPGGDETVIISFQDSGPGIAPETLDRIFEPYFSTREAGTGLGLAITQRIVQEHGGAITVQSAPGSGTTFRIEIPVEGPRRQEIASGAAADARRLAEAAS